MRNPGSAFWQMTARWRLNSEKSIFIYSQILRIKSVPLYDWINLAGISYPKNFIGGYIVQWTINQKKKPALGIFKFRPITHLQSIFTWLCLTTTEADPGFPRRGRQPMSLGQKPIIWQDFCRKLWKWTLAPPASANGLLHRHITSEIQMTPNSLQLTKRSQEVIETCIDLRSINYKKSF